jgi:hypothetical protein
MLASFLIISTEYLIFLGVYSSTMIAYACVAPNSLPNFKSQLEMKKVGVSVRARRDVEIFPLVADRSNPF